MRTIVAFLFGSVAVFSQGAQEMERLERNIAAHPNDGAPRVALLTELLNRAPSLPLEDVRRLRRENIIWLVEHQPSDQRIFELPQLLLSATGRLADPEGSAEVVALWKDGIARPGVKPEIVANAAIYLRAIDLPLARSILDSQPPNPAISHARGVVDAAAIEGISGLGPSVQFESSSALRDSELAKSARAEVEASTDANLVGKAGASLAAGRVEFRADPTFGDEMLALGERWLRRAIELGPPGTAWKQPLAQALATKANRTLDPAEKARLLTEALSLAPDSAKPGILQNLLAAEFNAGDDAAAERDANLLLSMAPKNANAYNAAQTTLGRIAASKGDLSEAKSRLMASVRVPAAIKNPVFQPEMTLAQDIYDAGDKDAVLEFLEASRTVWKFDRGRIDRMVSFVKKAPTVDLVQLSHQFPGSEMLHRPAPEFTATDRDGRIWTREQVAGKVVALEFGPEPLAEKIALDRGVTILRVQDDDTRRRFEVLTNPTVVVIDPQGNVSAFRSGPANEQEWKSDFENSLGRGPNPNSLPAPKQLGASADGQTVTLRWEPVDNAESYLVEWDAHDGRGWQFDRDQTVSVIATGEPSATLDSEGFMRIRWRVYAVPRSGQHGPASPWMEIRGLPLTKIYK